MADSMNTSVTSQQSAAASADKTKRKIRFLPLPQSSGGGAPELSFQQRRVWSPALRGIRVRTSVWLWIAIACLVVANILFLVAFLTNGWGILYVAQNTRPVAQPPVENAAVHDVSTTQAYIDQTPADNVDIDIFTKHAHDGMNLFAENERYWKFGLWECCRNDGFCLGTRWPGKY